MVFARPDGTTLDTEPVVTRIRDLTRDEALAACDACHGVYGGWGMLSTEGCMCRTRDVGTECRDGLECEGECEPTGTEPVRVDGALVGRRWVGQCSEFRVKFGCHARIPDAASLAPLLPARGLVHAPTLCVD